MSFPMIPGYSFPDPRKHRFQKSQALVYENGVQSCHDVPGIGGTLQPHQQPPKESISSTTLYNKILGSDTKTGETVPAWLAFSNEILRFYAYFKEPVFCSQDENYRVRNVHILFYLEDDTIQIYEPRVKNSGMCQGTLLRRHRAIKDDDSYVTVVDFKVEDEFELYGRTYFITDCDKFTAGFMAKLHRPVEERSPIPDDPYIKHREMIEYAETHRQRGEARPDLLKLRQFLANDGSVLRFYAYWDDRGRPFGDIHNFVIHFFLADDTMELIELYDPNDGRTNFPAFLRRSQVPKVVLDLEENDPRFLPVKYYYRPADLKIGSTINILNRKIFIFSCDNFTRKWYMDNMGMTKEELEPLSAPKTHEKKEYTFQVPPPTLFGSNEDTLQNCFSLHPKPPKKDEAKLVKYAHDMLRFKARLISINPVETTRIFIVTFHLADDTVSVYEPTQRNSGIVQGKYLQRMRLQNPDTGSYYKPEDFEIGKTIKLNGNHFYLIEATEYAMSYMEADSDDYPQADLQKIVDNIRICLKKLNQPIKRTFLQYSDHGKMDVNSIMKMCQAGGYDIGLHEATTLMRRYEMDSSHSFTLREFLQFAQ